MDVPTPTPRPTLIEIKERLGALSGGSPEKREFLSCGSVASGIPRGVLCEITGAARTAWMVDLLLENPALSTFWAEERLTILPTALHQRGVDLSRILIAETGERLFQTLRKALKSKLFDCVVLPGAIEEVKLLKALQLFAKESHACVFFLSKIPKSAWSIPVQLAVAWEGGGKKYRVEILKSKFMQQAPGDAEGVPS